jgi:hypothetical protein
MIEKQQIETLLQIQGMSATSPVEEIRSALLSAEYTAEEVEMAITVLRENVGDNTSRLDGLHKIYRTDISLQPKEITALLGVNFELSDSDIKVHRARGLSGGQNFLVLAVAMVLALSGVIYAMYVNQAGPFHPSAVSAAL